jgi:hypothetical protein
MPGMKVTVDAAMRARDVSRPQPHHDAAAEAAIADVPTLLGTPGTRVTPVPAPATRAPEPPHPAPPRPWPPVPGPPAPGHSGKPAPPPRPAVAPDPVPAPPPTKAQNASAGDPPGHHGTASDQAEPRSATQPRREGQGAPGTGRPARRKRVRRRRSRGH